MVYLSSEGVVAFKDQLDIPKGGGGVHRSGPSYDQARCLSGPEQSSQQHGGLLSEASRQISHEGVTRGRRIDSDHKQSEDIGNPAADTCIRAVSPCGPGGGRFEMLCKRTDKVSIFIPTETGRSGHAGRFALIADKNVNVIKKSLYLSWSGRGPENHATVRPVCSDRGAPENGFTHLELEQKKAASLAPSVTTVMSSPCASTAVVVRPVG
jgi:hypothetical protein